MKPLAALIGLLLVAPVGRAFGQAILPMRVVDYPLHSGVHDGAGQGSEPVFEQVVSVPGASWMRLRFRGAELGQQSLIALTSLTDGGYQPLDAVGLRHWNDTSATFVGDALLVQLFAAPGDVGVQFELAQVWVDAEPAPAPPAGSADGICGQDSNEPVSDNRVCRLVVPTSPTTGIVCTAWRVTNGALVTAGHCVDLDPDKEGPMLPDGAHDLANAFVEFNVPLSDTDGALNPASPQDQYPLDLSYLDWQFFGEDVSTSEGNDWGVLGVFPNTTTGLLPHEAYGVGIRVSHESPDSDDTVIVTGFGTDNLPPGSTGDKNEFNATNQWAHGQYDREDTGAGDGYIHHYDLDTTGGDSGAPLLVPATWPDVAIGIHSASEDDGCAAIATSLESDDVEIALHHFPGPSVVYADVGYPLAVAKDGNIYRPFATVVAAVNAAPPGALVSVVAGNYTQAAGNAITISKTLVLEAPMGSAVIGG